METNHLLIKFVILASCLIHPRVCSPSCYFPAIFNFGDSNSDTGGLSAAFGQAPYPNGRTFFHSPSGRFSDGRLIIDFIAEELGLQYLSAFLDSIGSNFTHGANFATAGSTVRPPNSTISQGGSSPISLDVQLVEFSDFITRSQLIRNQGGVFKKLLPKKEYFSQALYIFDIGQNDLTSGLKLNMTTDQIKAYIPDVLDQFSNAIRKVYSKGGRIFWIHNTAPLGCLPYVLDRIPVPASQIDNHGCAIPRNEIARYYNSELKRRVIGLRKELSDAAFTYVDIYSVKLTLITQAKKLGFRYPLVACCGHGGKYNYNKLIKCGAKVMVGGKEIVLAKSCNDVSFRVSWDGIHFTETTNNWIFQQINGGAFTDPHIPLKFACTR
ncbi:GDSL lipase/esterase [Arabidopsis thaliana x Arabidopsis arenosa]|uniref:GDSL lipase/esterase n=1 Tax=Arabidopsis thaliana x Arabidopsis arenosa TaxID=1240361 RepID=A0A8T1ZKP5_9BRAS|nr:GDSL lipase/esterase [Arabidopsis thaliana x Arabidopsis arenosa]